jgi:hypothetical protein
MNLRKAAPRALEREVRRLEKKLRRLRGTVERELERVERELSRREAHRRATTVDRTRIFHKMIRCGRPECKCAGGELHGPYWYALDRYLDGHTGKQRYLGTQRPAGVAPPALRSAGELAAAEPKSLALGGLRPLRSRRRRNRT